MAPKQQFLIDLKEDLADIHEGREYLVGVSVMSQHKKYFPTVEN